MAKRREVVLAEIFFSDAPDSKTRPCIVLSDGAYCDGKYSVVAMITSECDEHCLPISENDAGCRFYGGSGVRFNCMARIGAAQLERRIGKVAPEFYSRLVGRINGIIGK
ncbi:MAG: hypothetical protein WCT52_01950 [Candidatus Micrarchaeia archaeon]